MGADPVGVAVLDQVRRLVDDLRRAGVHVLEVRTLTQLATAVEHIIAPGPKPHR